MQQEAHKEEVSQEVNLKRLLRTSLSGTRRRGTWAWSQRRLVQMLRARCHDLIAPLASTHVSESPSLPRDDTMSMHTHQCYSVHTLNIFPMAQELSQRSLMIASEIGDTGKHSKKV